MSKSTTWPNDAIMIIASREGEEIRKNMEAVVDVRCVACNAKLRADSKSIRHAAELPSRGGRPIKFFCIECATKHDFNSIEELHDDRK